VNDTPALKNSNIGVAMGGGSDVAKEAGALVLLDNNFSSLIVAIENGRLVFDNLKKVALYLLPAGSFSELMPVLANFFLGIPLPLSSFLMIIICILTDMAPSLSLMYEKPEADLLTRPPRNPKEEHLVNAQFFLHAYGFVGVLETIAAFTLWFKYLGMQGLAPSDIWLAFNNFGDGYSGTSDQLNEIVYTSQTIYFVTLVICQFGNLLAVRTRTRSVFQQNPLSGPTANPYLFAAMLASLVISLLIVYLPVFHDIFQTRPIPVQFWFWPIPWAILILCADEIRKLIVRKFPRSIVARLAW